MSDGAISQDEIEALLSGVDLGGGGGSMGGSPAMPSGPSIDINAIQTFIDGTVGAFTSGMQTMTGSDFTIGNPVIELTNRDMLLLKLPEMVVTIASDFSQGLVGDHVFILPPELAQKIVSLVNKEEGAEIDDMALSVIGEFVSQQVGTEITALAAKFPGLASNPAQATHVPKGTVNFNQEQVMLFSYPVSGDGSYTIWEVMSQNVANEISNALAGPSPSMGGGLSADEMASLGGGMSGLGMGGMSGMENMGGGMSIPGMNIPNVQSLQYPNLQQGMNSMEQGNISLIMDVYMEMTVELGRTKKQIKEILGMGEGTIIELDKLAGEPVDILVNHKPIAKGEVVVIDENFGVRVTEILSPIERVSDLH